jgi:DsbC/DsbD-like thiol-disulfide interchange protein
MNVSYFEDEVVFQQKIKLNKATTAVKGSVEFMVCNDKSCLPPAEVTFTIPVK